jgi:hypothetical protein
MERTKVGKIAVFALLIALTVMFAMPAAALTGDLVCELTQEDMVTLANDIDDTGFFVWAGAPTYTVKDGSLLITDREANWCALDIKAWAFMQARISYTVFVEFI